MIGESVSSLKLELSIHGFRSYQKYPFNDSDVVSASIGQVFIVLEKLMVIYVRCCRKDEST